ncbi:hypothetical protein AC578_8932 [Pseudocercospora eumusae]|uniref:Uncharacterized protein n=1 Tax=Pseudocercospora eumusae TaxID=321146 RepID=A0A139HMZ3_9PEZI|nr:hypothetical protein AC578_8932 [Pseudocercospora eumusae]
MSIQAFWRQAMNIFGLELKHQHQKKWQGTRSNCLAGGRGASENCPDASKEDFDLRCVLLNQEITRELIEEEYLHVRTQAAHAAVDFDDRPDYFVFAGSAEDGGFGYDVSDEARTDQARIDQRLNDWVDAVEEKADPQVEEHTDVQGGLFKMLIQLTVAVWCVIKQAVARRFSCRMAVDMSRAG